MKLNKILQNINILNIVLMAVVVAFAVYSVFPTLEMKVKYALPAAKNPAEKTDEEPGEPEIPSITQYTSIADENLFHPERRIPPEKKDEPPLPKPEFVLYGTMISDDFSLAYLEDMKAPRNTPGRGKRQVALKKGDSMSGFILKEIETDKITMVRGEEKLIVAMNDPQKPKIREVVATAPAAAATPPKQPQQAAPATTPAHRQRESRRAVVGQDPTNNTSPPPLTRALDAGQQPSPSTAKPIPTSPSPPVTPGKSSGGLGDYYRKILKR